MAFTLKITDHASDRLRKVSRGVTSSRSLMAALGGRVELELKSHFAIRQSAGNRHGWANRNFWSGVGANTHLATITEDSATVGIDDPTHAFEHKIKGGTIQPKRGKYLAIPLTQEAYEAGSPRERGVDDLQCIRAGNMLLLVRRDATQLGGGRKHKGDRAGTAPGQQIGGTAEYLLVRSVTQRADPRALPDTETLNAAVADEGTRFIAGVLNR